jgi:hypothetical protein
VDEQAGERRVDTVADEESEVTTEFLSETEAAATVSSTTSTEPAPSPVDADDEAKPNCQ